ncbi:MAG: sigma-70 family RNA polymerase sigma factor [Balneolaceae bacterium]
MDVFKYAQVATYSDEDLMEYFQEGRELAFNELVKRYTDRLHNFLFRYTHNHQDCEDLVQETFLRVHKSKKSYQRIAKFSTWMYTIALNLAKSMYKKKQRMQKVSIHKDENDPKDFEMLIEDKNILPDEELHQKLSLKKLEKALMNLAPEFREVVVYRDLQELSYDEIAEITGVAMGTVKSRINRGRAQIQSMIESYVDMGTSF